MYRKCLIQPFHLRSYFKKHHQYWGKLKTVAVMNINSARVERQENQHAKSGILPLNNPDPLRGAEDVWTRLNISCSVGRRAAELPARPGSRTKPSRPRGPAGLRLLITTNITHSLHCVMDAAGCACAFHVDDYTWLAFSWDSRCSTAHWRCFLKEHHKHADVAKVRNFNTPVTGMLYYDIHIVKKYSTPQRKINKFVVIIIRI